MKIHVLDDMNEAKYRGMRDMERKKVTAYGLKIGDRVMWLGDTYTVEDWYMVDGDGKDKIKMKLTGYGYGVFDTEVFTIVSGEVTPDNTQYIRILETLAGDDIVNTARNIHEALQ